MKNSIVQNIANKLFLSRSNALEYELNEYELSLVFEEKLDGYSLEDNKLTFSSYDDRDYYIAYHYFSEIANECANSDNIILVTALNIWKKSLYGDRKIAGLFLSLYEERIDIWELLLVSECTAYEITSLADQFMMYMKNIDIQKIFNFFSYVYKERNQYVGFYPLLQARLTNDPQKCQDIINEFYSSIQLDTAQLFNIALFALANQNYSSTIDILIDNIEKENSILSTQSLWVLGKIINKSDYKNNEIVEIIKNTISSSVLSISNAGMQVAVDTVERLPEVKYIIRNLLEENNYKIMELLSIRLYTTNELIYHDDYSFWLSCICKNSMGNDSISDTVFHIFTYLAKNESTHDLLLNCIFIFMENNKLSENSDNIEELLHEVVYYPSLLNKLFTMTLIDENLEFTIFSRSIETYLIVNQSEHTLECSLDIINHFTEQDFIFLVRRILGVISHEIQLVSLMFSLLKIDNSRKRIYAIVKSVMINEIAMDYPYYVLDEVKRRKDNSKNKKGSILNLYDEILFEIDKYISSFDSLPRVKEFEPPSSLVNAYQKERNKVSLKNNELNKGDSFIFKVANQVILKAGIGSFYYNDFNIKGYSEPSYLHEFSTSYSLPRRYVMDNVGYNIRIIEFRHAKKDMI
ncbi:MULTISPECIES: hypothetical protein [unclassified Providencia]|uniref:hypothetical protein n=1 Tax=unclassified Providencia TaxID=2633465 RepID=UPI00234B871E|nr:MULTISPECIES: hypothetical protein [unclassified Providencia]WOC01111.1 hypothetical protein P3L55_07315 [Providencia sp. PROV046]